MVPHNSFFFFFSFLLTILLRSQLFVTPVPGESNTLSWPQWGRGVHMTHRHTCRQNTPYVSLNNFLKIFICFYLMCTNVLPVYVYVPHKCLVPTEARRGHWLPWNWSYRLLWISLWVSGTEPRSSPKAANAALSHSSSPKAHEVLGNIGPVCGTWKERPWPGLSTFPPKSLSPVLPGLAISSLFICLLLLLLLCVHVCDVLLLLLSH